MLRFFSCCILGVVLPLGAFAGPFSLDVEVFSADSLNRVGGVSADFSPPVSVAPVEEPSRMETVSVVEKPVVVLSPKVEPVRLGLDLPVEVGEGSKKDRPSLAGIRFVGQPLEQNASAPKVSEAPPVGNLVLPPLEKGVGPLPPANGEQAAAALLVSRDGKVLEGVPAMVDYLTDGALPAKPVVRSPLSSQDEFLSSLGSPTGRPEVDPMKVETSSFGVVAPGAAFGGFPSGPASAGDATGLVGGGQVQPQTSGFFPAPPAGYQGVETAEPTPPIVSGGLW